MSEHNPEFNFADSKVGATSPQNVQTVNVDERLQLVRVSSPSVHTRIVGTNRNQITVKTRTGYSPSIEFKEGGREVEIKAVVGSYWTNRLVADPDVASVQPKDDFDGGDEPPNWNDPLARAYRNQRRQVEREARRQFKEQQREAERQHRRAWFNLDFENLSELMVGIGKTFNELLSMNEAIYIEIPAGVELELKSVSGMVEVYNMEGFCRLNSTNGIMRLYDLSGGSQLKCANGKIEAGGLGGRVNAKIIHSNMRLSDCRLTGLDMSVNNGNVSLEMALVGSEEGDYKISNSNGNVGLMLPRNTRASIECRTLNGKIRVQPEAGVIEERNRPGQSQSKTELNGGGRKVSLNTMNGNIEIGFYDRPQGRPTPPPPPMDWPVPPPPVPPVFNSEQQGFVPPAAPPYQPSAPVVTPAPPTSWPTSTVAESEEKEAREAGPETEAAGEGRKNRQLEILRAIEQGEISIEEGMARLGELDES